MRWPGSARFALLGVVLGVLMACLPAELPVALSVLAVLMLPVFGWLAVAAPRAEAAVLAPIVVGAVAARVLAAVVIAYAVPGDYFSIDQGRYQELGLALVDHWTLGVPYPVEISGKPGYYAWNALIYLVVGYVPLAVTLANAAIAAMSVIVTWRIAHDLGGERAARWAALFAAFFPSLVLWSSLNLKDAAAMLAILLALRGAQRLQAGLGLGGVLQLALGVLALMQLREYLVFILVTGIGMALLLARLRAIHAPWVVAAACALVLVSGDLVSPVERLTEDASLETLDRHRRNLALGDSAYHGDADVSTPRAALRFLPTGVAYFLLAPAPWQLWGSRQWLTLPEMLVWYALIPQVFFGLRHAWRTRLRGALPLVAYGLLATVSYGLVEANLGTAYRHRAQVLIVYLVFAAIGLASRRRSRTHAESGLGEAVPA